jgi:hypothetical protein
VDTPTVIVLLSAVFPGTSSGITKSADDTLTDNVGLKSKDTSTAWE